MFLFTLYRIYKEVYYFVGVSHHWGLYYDEGYDMKLILYSSSKGCLFLKAVVDKLHKSCTGKALSSSFFLPY